MMYPFMTFNDNTEVTHSHMLEDGRVKVYIETPDEKDGFHHLTCYLPEYDLSEVYGYTDDEVAEYMDYIRSVAHLCIEFSQTGGFDSASGF